MTRANGPKERTLVGRHRRLRSLVRACPEYAVIVEPCHLITWNTYQDGKYTLDDYLDRVIFYKARPFTRSAFQRFMFAQSKPYPEKLKLMARLEARYRLKIVVVSNEGRELNAYRIDTFKLTEIADAFFHPASFTCANPTSISSGWPWTSLRCRRLTCSTSKTRQCSWRSQKGWEFAAFSIPIQHDLRETGVVRIADRRRVCP